MELKAKFEGIKEIKSKEGKAYKVLCFIYDHRIVEIFDFNETFTTILLDNKVVPMQEVKIICSIGVDRNNHLYARVENVEV